MHLERIFYLHQTASEQRHSGNDISQWLIKHISIYLTDTTRWESVSETDTKRKSPNTFFQYVGRYHLMVKFLFNFIISPFYDMLLLSLSEALNIWKSAWWLPFLKSKGKLGW